MTDRRSRTVTMIVTIVGATLVLYGATLLLDSRPVGPPYSQLHCGNAFWDGSDSEADPGNRCENHEVAGRFFGGSSVLAGTLLLGGDAWRRSRRAKRSQERTLTL